VPEKVAVGLWVCSGLLVWVNEMDFGLHVLVLVFNERDRVEQDVVGLSDTLAVQVLRLNVLVKDTVLPVGE